MTLITRDDPRIVVGLPFDQFLAYMRDVWQPGQHIACVGPTGEGKTTTCGGLLSIRKWVMALDPKGEDDTLSATGYTRVARLPNEIKFLERLARSETARQWEAIHAAIADGRPARVIIGGAARTEKEDFRNQALMRSAFPYCREAGGWTLYVDEFELISSQRMFKLGPQVERMLITARKDGTSVVTAFQAAAWVSKHATRQARFAIVWPTGDRDMIKSIASSMGRDWRELAVVIDELPPWHVVVVPRGKNGGPFIVTSAPSLN